MVNFIDKANELYSQIEQFEGAIEDYNNSPMVADNDDIYIYNVSITDWIKQPNDFNSIDDIHDIMTQLKHGVKNFDEAIWNATNSQSTVHPQVVEQIAQLKEQYIAMMPIVTDYLYTKIMCIIEVNQYDLRKLAQYTNA